MDFELKNLGQTLAVGSFAIYGLLFLVRICRAKWISRFFLIEGGKLPIQHTAVYLALIFATGIILEDISKDFTAQRISWLKESKENSLTLTDNFKRLTSRAFNSILDTDSDLRLRSLFTSKHGASTFKPVPMPIFEELESIKHHSPIANKHLNKIREILYGKRIKYEGEEINGAGVEITDNNIILSFRRAVDGLYYDAKNLVYREDNYFKELNDLPQRIDFTRSLTFLCALFFVCI